MNARAKSEEDKGMPWTWRYLGADGQEVAQSTASPRFPAQADAETWIGEVWHDLFAEGVEAVTLLEGDREVYGPMSLRPAD
jgi:hypothetical protein